MAIRANYPDIKPSLNLDFANTKQLDPRITFTRTTTARYYDGKTVAKAEENLLLQSQDFTTTWVNTRSTDSANTATAPDGTTTADSVLQASGETISGAVNQSPTVSAGTYAISVFAKPNGKNFLRFAEAIGTGSTVTTWFDVQNGTVGTTGAGHTATISAAANGFYRCVIVLTVNAARTAGIVFGLADTDNSTTVTDNQQGLYLWGAQLEQRSSVTAYTATTTQAITNYIPVLQTAAAGQARFDHNPTTGESLGLLIEEQRSNLLIRSEEFDNATWAKTRSSITANAIIAPDGTLTGDKLVEDTTASNSHFIGNSVITVTSGAAYAFSVYVKAGERTRVALTSFGETTSVFNLSTGTVASAGSNTCTITSVGNGWYRCTAVITKSNTTGAFYIFLDNGTTTSYTGDGYSGVFIWGAQLEAGSFSTSYIKTEAASATRNADAASMTGTNFSSWYRADEGTVYAEYVYGNGIGSTAQSMYSFSDGGETNRLIGFKTSTPAQQFDETGGASIVISGAAANTAYKSAVGYKVNDMAVSINGATVSTDTSVTISAKNQLTLGDRVTGSRALNGTIKKIAYYPARLTNAQLQGITTV